MASGGCGEAVFEREEDLDQIFASFCSLGTGGSVAARRATVWHRLSGRLREEGRRPEGSSWFRLELTHMLLTSRWTLKVVSLDPQARQMHTYAVPYHASACLPFGAPSFFSSTLHLGRS